MAKPTPEQFIGAAAHAVGLLNELEATLTGWVLQFDKEAVSEQLEPIYTRLDLLDHLVETGGAASRAARFSQGGDTEVLTEGLREEDA